jgi:hypothetical protein
MFDLSVNYVALIVAALAVFILGWLWYTVLFGKAWVKEMGKSMEGVKPDGGMMAKSYILMYLATIVMGYVLAHILQFADVATTMEAINTAFWVWLGFFVAGNISHYLFPAKSFKLFLIDQVYQLLVLIIVSVILTLWG